MIRISTKEKLKAITAKTDLRKIKGIFKTLIAQIQSYLQINPVREQVEILLSRSSDKQQNIFNIGVKRDLSSHSLVLFTRYNKYFPLIILREAYNCFIPPSLLENKYVQIIIHQLVINNLSKFTHIDEWKIKIDQKIVDLELIQAYFDRFKKFLDERARIQLIFQFLQQKELVIESMGDSLYENIVHNFLWTAAMNINDDEFIETVRILFNLFKKHKTYKSQEEYVTYFQQYAAEDKTRQSKRQFEKNMGRIKDHSPIAPSYQVNWASMNILLLDFYFQFNPLLSPTTIFRIIERFPFLYYYRRVRTDATMELTGYFLIPIIYLKDLLSLLEKMSKWGYLIKKRCCQANILHNFLNLNYFREFHNAQEQLINFDHSQYQHKYEMEVALNYQLSSKTYPELSLLDLNILQRAANLSFTGFTFEKRVETLNLFKEDIENMLISEERVVNDIKRVFSHLTLHPKDRADLLHFIKNFSRGKEVGYFNIHFLLEDLLTCLTQVHDILLHNHSITNSFQFQAYFLKHGLSTDLKINILFNDKKIHHLIFTEILPLYFQSHQAFLSKLKQLQLFHDFFSLCTKLKVFNLTLIKQMIERKKERETIYNSRKKKIESYFEEVDPNTLQSKQIETKLDEFVSHDPPVLSPMLINTIATSAFSNYFPQLILNDTAQTRKKVKELIRYFPRSLVLNTEDLVSKQKQISLIIYLPNIKEKRLFLSILQSIFSDSLLSFSRNYMGGLVGVYYTFMDLYDLKTKKFFYTKDLLDQFFLYITQTFGKIPKVLPAIPHHIPKKWQKTSKTLDDLRKKVELRSNKNKKYREKKVLDALFTFHTTLRSNLINDTLNFNISLIRRYLKSIAFIPAFHRFGLSQYYLFIHPLSLEDPKNEWVLDWKLLLGNTFQRIQYPVRIEACPSLFVSYIYPYRNPNTTYLHWLAKSKRVIREYFIFFVKKISPVFRLNTNLNADNKWNYDADVFKIHIHNILFNPDYHRQLSTIKQFDLGTLKSSEILGPESEEFQNLATIYNWRAADLHPYYYRKNKASIQFISDLLKKKLIFPYVALKNLNFIEKIYIILPQVKKEALQKLIQIFDFFNYGYLYEIEGEYFIHGMNKEVRFENGMMIELYFPDCKMFQFQELFEQVFQYLTIDHYMILNDLIDGKPLLKNIYGDLKFLKQYNPLANLIWNKLDKRWLNHKLFTEHFEPVYPSLFPEKE